MPIHISRRTVVLLGALLATACGTAAGSKPSLNTDRAGLAVRGYDVVAYVTDGKPVPGREAFETQWNGARWRFASAEHRERFLGDPGKYAPQFGGYCAYAVSRGYTADTDPHAWKLVDGKLYLNYSTEAQAKWSEDIPGNIARGRANWPRVLER